LPEALFSLFRTRGKMIVCTCKRGAIRFKGDGPVPGKKTNTPPHAPAAGPNQGR